MNAITKTPCIDAAEYARRDDIRSDAQISGIAPCGRISSEAPEISSSKSRWGGARANAGGARANSGGARPNSGGVREGAGRPKVTPFLDVDPSWEGHRWCVYMTHPQAELTASREVTRIGYRQYMPLTAILKQDPVLRSRFTKVRVPMFPGYGFVALTCNEPWVPIRYTMGVRDVLLSPTQRPAPIPIGFVESLIEGEADRCDLTAVTLPQFDRGAAVQITEGAMSGHIGSVVECDGLKTLVSVELFGRLVAVRLDRAGLVGVKANAA